MRRLFKWEIFRKRGSSNVFRVWGWNLLARWEREREERQRDRERQKKTKWVSEWETERQRDWDMTYRRHGSWKVLSGCGAVGCARTHLHSFSYHMMTLMYTRHDSGLCHNVYETWLVLWWIGDMTLFNCFVRITSWWNWWISVCVCVRERET